MFALDIEMSKGVFGLMCIKKGDLQIYHTLSSLGWYSTLIPERMRLNNNQPLSTYKLTG